MEGQENASPAENVRSEPCYIQGGSSSVEGMGRAKEWVMQSPGAENVCVIRTRGPGGWSV